jgi:hypothetical protein
MKIEKLSEQDDIDSFLLRFANVSEHINTDQSRPRPSPMGTVHLLKTFAHVPKELIIISDQEKDLARVCINQTKADEDYILFGFLEYEISRPELLKLLMDEVESYAQVSQRSAIIGPVDINVWFGNRFKKAGFEDQRSWEPNSPKEYLQEILKLGYKLDQDYLSAFYLDTSVSLQRTKPAYDKAISEGYTFRNLDPSTEEETRKLYTTNIKGFCHNYFYEPITYEEYVGTHIRALDGFDFKYSFWILDSEGKEWGYVFSYPDHDERMIIKSIVMVPDKRGAKLSSALVHRSLLSSHENGIIKGCGACVRKGNISEHFFDHLGEKEKEHLYTLVSKKLN